MKVTSIQRFLNQVKASSNFEVVSSDTQLDVIDTRVIFDSDAGSIAVTLPPVNEAAGFLYSFAVPTTGSSSSTNVTLQDGDESYDWQGDYTLDADNDRILLYSDGYAWHDLANNIA